MTSDKCWEKSDKWREWKTWSKIVSVRLRSIHISLFLYASSHFYKRISTYVRPCVRPSVRPYVRPSVSISEKSPKSAEKIKNIVVVYQLSITHLFACPGFSRFARLFFIFSQISMLLSPLALYSVFSAFFYCFYVFFPSFSIYFFFFNLDFFRLLFLFFSVWR